MTNSPITQVRIPEDWRTEMERFAERQGMTLSEWIRFCCLQQMTPTVVKRLTEVKIGRPSEADE